MDSQGCELAAKLIKRKAKQLVGRYGLRLQDKKDIEQDLWVAVAESDGYHDPERGRRFSLLAKVVDNAAASLLRRRHRECRDYRKTVNTESGGPGDVICDMRLRRPPTHPSDLSIDLEDAIEALPDIPKWVVNRLRDYPMTESAAALNVSRAKLYELLGHARKLLKHLETYLELPDTSKDRGVVSGEEPR